MRQSHFTSKTPTKNANGNHKQHGLVPVITDKALPASSYTFTRVPDMILIRSSSTDDIDSDISVGTTTRTTTPVSFCFGPSTSTAFPKSVVVQNFNLFAFVDGDDRDEWPSDEEQPTRPPATPKHSNTNSRTPITPFSEKAAAFFVGDPPVFKCTNFFQGYKGTPEGSRHRRRSRRSHNLFAQPSCLPTGHGSHDEEESRDQKQQQQPIHSFCSSYEEVRDPFPISTRAQHHFA